MQPVTAEEVQAAVNLTPASSSQQLQPTHPGKFLSTCAWINYLFIVYIAADEYFLHDNAFSIADTSIIQTSELHVRYIYEFGMLYKAFSSFLNFVYFSTFH